MNTPTSALTVVLGASPRRERYSYLAFQTLREQNRALALVNPQYTDIEGVPVVAQLAEVAGPIDTLSMYLAPAHQEALFEAIAAARPRRVIFNPGSENPDLARRLTALGIPCLEACTLVLLRTNQY